MPLAPLTPTAIAQSSATQAPPPFSRTVALGPLLYKAPLAPVYILGVYVTARQPGPTVKLFCAAQPRSSGGFPPFCGGVAPIGYQPMKFSIENRLEATTPGKLYGSTSGEFGAQKPRPSLRLASSVYTRAAAAPGQSLPAELVYWKLGHRNGLILFYPLF